jgi:hypothetical protein
MLTEFLVDIALDLQDAFFTCSRDFQHREYLPLQMISTVPNYIRLAFDHPLDHRTVLLVECEHLLNRAHVVDACEVHVELHGSVVLREFPKLLELLGIYHKWLAEKEQVYWQF